MRRRGSGRQVAASPRDAAPGRKSAALRRGLIVFALALAVRLLFWQATPDSSWPDSAWFKGDAPVWLEFSSALERGEVYELGLPIHPPGTAYLVAALWNGKPETVPFLRFVWVLLGAATVALFSLAARRGFGAGISFALGIACAAASGLMVLSSSINVETPYLLLVAASFLVWEKLRDEPGLTRLGAWSALQGVACLFRVEHLLFYLAMLFLLFRVSRAGKGLLPARAFLASLALFLLPLVPWHASAWSKISRFNERSLAPAPTARVIPWDPGALREEARLPAFARSTASAFLEATLYRRGGDRVRSEDFRILGEAFGYTPRPIGEHPFVSSYGPLNFALANNSHAGGGFSRALLEESPPLRGGAALYPAELVVGLPPADFSFVYPPHLRLFNEGYRVGWQWIRQNPVDYLRLAGRKLRIFWSGAALGFTGYNFPIGLSGIRRSVDMVVPEPGPVAAGWRLALLIGASLGLIAGFRGEALHPWLLFLATKVVVTLLFFGYARQGASVIPVVLLLNVLAAVRWLSPWSRRLPHAVRQVAPTGVVLLILMAEGTRIATAPAVTIDGRSIASGDPFPDDRHSERRIALPSSD